MKKYFKGIRVLVLFQFLQYKDFIACFVLCVCVLSLLCANVIMALPVWFIFSFYLKQYRGLQGFLKLNLTINKVFKQKEKKINRIGQEIQTVYLSSV